MIIEDTAVVYRRGNNAEEAHPEEYKVTLPFESKDWGFHKNIGIGMSGGLDSSLLLWMLAHHIDENELDVTIYIWSCIHEGGHAVHSFYTKDMDLAAFKSTPSEVAELASMSMELISMEHWNVFFDNEEDLKRARIEQLHGVLSTLPWVAMVDEFQHWLYENKDHSHLERHNQWIKITERYGTNCIDWTGYEEQQKTSWQRQRHIYEVPFYYIEYGMAQLGAIAVWRNYKLSPERALDAFDSALQLGYTKTIGEIYVQAGIQFDFSPSYVKELATFVKQQLLILE